MALPNYVQQSFVSGQQLISHYKEQSSLDIIRDMYSVENSKKTVNLNPIFETAQNVAKLTMLWYVKNTWNSPKDSFSENT